MYLCTQSIFQISHFLNLLTVAELQQAEQSQVEHNRALVAALAWDIVLYSLMGMWSEIVYQVTNTIEKHTSWLRLRKNWRLCGTKIWIIVLLWKWVWLMLLFCVSRWITYKVVNTTVKSDYLWSATIGSYLDLVH